MVHRRDTEDGLNGSAGWGPPPIFGREPPILTAPRGAPAFCAGDLPVIH